MNKTCTLNFPPNWINAIEVDKTLSNLEIEPYNSKVKEVIFFFPNGSKVLIDAAVQLLSLANQLVKKRKRVLMRFEEGIGGAMGYLARMCFFKELKRKVKIDPPLDPSFMRSNRSSSDRVVVISPINPRKRNKKLPGILAAHVAHDETGSANKEQLQDSVFTVLSELIDNVFQHSSTRVSGYAAFQVYPMKKKAMVVVSDSGKGILQTLKPALRRKRYKKYRGLSDTNLLVEMFKTGISRKGKDRGCGLKACADRAIKYNADLRIRLKHCAVYLKPSGNQYVANPTYQFDGLPLLEGTHISFAFHIP